ncbi:MAG: MFS transporter, partial [Acidimicrobiia bacterium]|nr:MFS transporter [Acidimicrobiia bacterium]
GLSVGGIVLTPIASYLIGRHGLGSAGPPMAVIWLAGIVPIALLVVRPFPASLGLRPDGEHPAEPSLDADHFDRELPGDQRPAPGPLPPHTVPNPSPGLAEEPVVGATFAQVRTTRFFLGLCATYLLIFFGQVGALAQLFNMVQERTDATIAQAALSTLAATSVLARLAGGFVVLRVDTRIFTIALTLVQVMALAFLALAGSAVTVIGAVIVFGMSIGNLLMLQPLLLAEAFGVADYSRIYSSSQLIGTVGVAAGPFALGVVRDVADYRLAFIMAALVSLLGAGALMGSGSTDSVKRLWITTDVG